MSNVIALLYTTVGAVLGAGLTQYVTQIRERRASRAVLIEQLYDAERLINAYRWTPVGDDSVNLFDSQSIKYDKALTMLESACLIAGISRAITLKYTTLCRLYEGLEQANLTGIRLLETVNHRVFDGESDTVKKTGELVAANQEMVERVRAAADKARADALEIFSRAIWHPFLVQFGRISLRRVERDIENLEKLRRQLADRVREGERLVGLGSKRHAATAEAVPESPSPTSLA